MSPPRSRGIFRGVRHYCIYSCESRKGTAVYWSPSLLMSPCNSLARRRIGLTSGKCNVLVDSVRAGYLVATKSVGCSSRGHHQVSPSFAALRRRVAVSEAETSDGGADTKRGKPERQEQGVSRFWGD